MNTTLDARKMLTGELTRLRAAIRFNNCFRNHNESVAEHTNYVSLFGLLIAEALTCCLPHERPPLMQPIDWRKLSLALAIHDVEEGRSGDFPHDFKYSSIELSAMLSRAAAVAANQVVKDFAQDRLADRVLFAWENAKDETIEGKIVGVADLLATLQYVWMEVQTGNRLILRQCADLPTNLYRMTNDPKFADLFFVLLPAHQLCQELYKS